MKFEDDVRGTIASCFALVTRFGYIGCLLGAYFKGGAYWVLGGSLFWDAVPYCMPERILKCLSKS